MIDLELDSGAAAAAEKQTEEVAAALGRPRWAVMPNHAAWVVETVESIRL